MPGNEDYSGLLPLLRFNLRESPSGEGCECPGRAGFSDAELLTLLEKHRGDLNAASYEGLLLKARSDSIRLPDGLELPDGSDYWLRLARMYRPARTGLISRIDEVN